MPADGDPTLDPDRIRSTGFSTSFRGYDQHEVRRFLDQLAEAVSADRAGEERAQVRVRAEEEVGGLRAELSERDATIEQLRAELAARESELAEASVFDEDRAAELLGRETTRVLEAARRAAAELTRKSAEQAEQVRIELSELRSATEAELAELRAGTRAELAEARAACEAEVDERRRSAEAEAAELLAAAEAEAQRLESEVREAVARRQQEAEEVTAGARAEAARLRAEAEADVEAALEAAREQGREMIAEARSVRERVLSDLVRRRRASRQQVDQLKAGRDRMARALLEVRRQLDDAMGELTVAVPEARQAAGGAVRRDDDGDVAREVASLERELDSSRTFVRTAGSDRDGNGAATASSGAPPGGGAAERTEVEARLVEGQQPDAPPFDAPMPEPSDADPPDESAPVPPAAAGRGATDLDSLFARIRAGRTSSVTHARQVLAQGGPSPDEGAVDAGAPAVAPGDEGPGPHRAPAAGAAQDPTSAPPVALPGVGADVDPGPQGTDEGEVEPVDEATLVEVFAARDRALASLERDVVRKLKRAMADTQSELLDVVGRGRGGVSTATLPSVDEHRQRYAHVVRRGFVAAVRAGAGAGGGEVDDRHAEQLVDALAHRVADPLQVRIEQSIESSGDERDVMLERIRAHYREFRTGELTALVGDALAEAYAVGLYHSFTEGTPLVWTPDPRVPVGPDCFDNSLAGAVVVPDPYPTGHLHPPGAPGCRCLTLAAGDIDPAPPSD